MNVDDQRLRTFEDATRRPQSRHVPSPVLAACAAGAAAIHFAMVPPHAAEELWHGLAFLVAAWVQLGLAVLLWQGASRRTLWFALWSQAAFVAAWAVSRTVGVPGGLDPWEPEEVGFVDLTAKALELVLFFGALFALRSSPSAESTTAEQPTSDGQESEYPTANVGTVPPRHRVSPAAALASVLALGISTAALASPDARHEHDDESHSHAADAGGEFATAASAPEHTHGDGSDHDHGEGHTDSGSSGEEPCDLHLNTRSYYREAELAGAHTHSAHAGHSDDDHGHGSAGEGEDEIAAAREVIRISRMSDAEYDDWLRSLDPANRKEGAPDDTGMGGHLGPQPWEHLTDPELCRRLDEEVQLARETALRYETAREAMEAGYVLVTPYVPGIASHWMNFSYVDGRFEVDKPEMLLYNGNGPESRIVGLSYYIVHQGDSEPTVGFTGDNDHYHRHIGLCVRGVTVIGPSSTTEEQCQKMGGRKLDFSDRWMSHAWVVPGCESPWGLFSAVNPRLDEGVPNSPPDGSPCSGGLRKYDDRPGPGGEET
ncbi:MAG: hypothetical protein KatS3mg008_0804 [Acidimicrobiales bacterium]|nr:MAG: hypothetical protein KatS3mg008_0804 [Acidimicrobiales bacterium]